MGNVHTLFGPCNPNSMQISIMHCVCLRWQKFKALQFVKYFCLFSEGRYAVALPLDAHLPITCQYTVYLILNVPH